MIRHPSALKYFLQSPRHIDATAMSCQPALVDVSSLLLLSAGALEDVQRLEAQGLQRKGYSQDNLASARQVSTPGSPLEAEPAEPSAVPGSSGPNDRRIELLSSLTMVAASLRSRDGRTVPLKLPER